MLVCYIHEVAKMDQEVATAIRKKPSIKPIGKAGDIKLRVKGKIDSQSQTFMFLRGDGQRCLFALDDKYQFSNSSLEHILELIHGCDQNCDADKKFFQICFDGIWPLDRLYLLLLQGC